MEKDEKVVQETEDTKEKETKEVDNGIKDVSDKDEKKIGGKSAEVDEKSKGGTMGSVGSDTDFGSDVLIPVGLSDDKSYDILSSVISQMSDGIWENSATVAKFWKYVDIVKDDAQGVCISIKDPEYWENGFRGKTIQEVKKYFAAKVKTLSKKYIDDSGLGDWKRDNKTPVLYLGFNDDITIQDAFKVYDALSGITNKSYESKDDDKKKGKRPTMRKPETESYEILPEDKDEKVGTVYTLEDAKERVNNLLKNFKKDGIYVVSEDFSDVDESTFSIKIGNAAYSVWVDVFVGGDGVTWDFNKYIFFNTFDDKVQNLLQADEWFVDKVNEIVDASAEEHGY